MVGMNWQRNRPKLRGFMRYIVRLELGFAK